jgi:hypothetical protein
MKRPNIFTRVVRAVIGSTGCPHGERSPLECERCFRASHASPPWRVDAVAGARP